MLHQHNIYITTFRTAKDKIESGNHGQFPEVSVAISAENRPRGQHEHRYNAPTSRDDIAAIVSNISLGNKRNIVIQYKSGELQQILESHRSYDPLQYLLLFPVGTDGWNLALKLQNPNTGEATNKQMTPIMYYAYRLMVRDGEPNYLH